MQNKWHLECRNLVDAARKGAEWINDSENEATVGLAYKATDRGLRRLVTSASKLEKSIDRPMCVGVFGPSQAGKSYLVSVLARKGERPLMAKFSGQQDPIDFITDINPGGERESTGVVTRFSLRDRKAPEGFPVCLRLLSETDIVKVLGNTYFLDGDQRKLVPPEEQEILAALAEARGRASASQPDDNRLSVDDIWDVQEYFERAFEGRRAIEYLRGFWDEAAELAPRLTLADRARLFSLLWGRFDKFTNLFIELSQALIQLDFASDAFCPMDALIPRTDSIIDVMTLRGLGKPGAPELKICNEAGKTVSLPRPLITALTAELHITILERPWEFFDHTDLLDFPGARGRKPLDLAEFLEQEENDPLKETLLRGKVAYLFERYVAEQELTSMLLCIKPSNQDVVDLPAMIEDWVAISHGPTPEARHNKTVVLFLILTMFDTHFVEKAGYEKASPGDRFKDRLHASLEEPFAKSSSWPHNWAQGVPFNNSYWLRNPNYPANSIIEYNESRQEVRFHPDKTDYIERLREGFLSVSEVTRYFREPQMAFDEALKLNDGGVSYLATNLEPVCRPEIKNEQIAGRLRLLRWQLHGLLKPFHVSNDIEKRLTERRGVSAEILTHVQRIWQEGRLADLLAAMQVSQHGFSGILYDYLTRRNAPAAEYGAESAAVSAPAARPMSLGPPPIPGLGPMPALPTAPKAPPQPKADQPAAAQPVRRTAPASNTALALASTAVAHWIGHLRTSAETGAIANFFLGDTRLSVEMVNEISQAARRTSLEQKVLAAIERLRGSVSEDIDMTLEKASFASSTMINRFVVQFYFDALAETDRPVAPTPTGNPEPVFSHPPAANSAREIALEASHQQYDALAHWMYAFHNLVEENATSVDGLDINVKQNDALGAIIASVTEPSPDA